MIELNEDMKSLVQQAKDIMTQSAIDYLLKPGFIDKETELYNIILEHDLNYAFPTHIGVSSTQDHKRLLEGDMDNIYLDGPYSYDTMTTPIEYSDEMSQLFDSANDTISDAYAKAGNPYDQEVYSAIDEYMFDVYVDVCKNIESALRESGAFTLSENFYMSANGFDQNNELKFVKALVNPERFDAIASEKEKIGF